MRIVFGLAACLCATIGTADANAQFTTIINVPPDSAPSQLDSDTQLNLFDGGNIGSLRAGDFFGTSTNVQVNIAGGTASTIWAYSGSDVDITGGHITNLFGAASGSLVSIRGGEYRMIRASSDSTLNLHSGSIYGSFRTEAGSHVSIFGGEFKLNGTPLSDTQPTGGMTTFTLPDESVLTGILEDGTVFIAKNQDRCSECHYDVLINSTLINASPPPVTQQTINDPSQLEQWGLRAGQVLNLTTGSVIGSGFKAVGSEINLSGGTINDYLKIADSTLNISSGVAGGSFEAFNNSVVNVHGGSFGENQSGGAFTPVLHRGVVLNQTGGSIIGVTAQDGSFVNISGGTYRSLFAQSGSQINIRGGTGSRYIAFENSTTNLFATSFVLDGIDITPELNLDESFLISDRDVILEGVYANGSHFSFSLSSSSIRTGAIVTVTLVPEPCTLGLIGVGAFGVMRRRRAG